MKAVASWSGGKDSCLALYRAGEYGAEVTALLSTISREEQRSAGHGLARPLLEAQAAALGFSLHAVEFGQGEYEAAFKGALKELSGQGVGALVTGDIYFQPHREWVERVCAEVGVQPIMPLWGQDPWGVVRGFLGAGFQAVIVSLQPGALGREWLGQPVNEDFLAHIKALGRVDPCGENGEFHTLVVDGPIFQRRIRLGKTGPVFREGHWFLDILSYEVVKKGERARS